MKRYIIVFLTELFILSSLVAADYPSEKELWNSFNSTPGSSVHVNRVFVRPDVKLPKEKKFKKKNASDEKANIRFRARREIRKKILNRIYSNLVPGESVFILIEKYDFFHECCYFSTLVTQRNVYSVEAYENKEKGVVIRKYPISSEDFSYLSVLAEQLKNSDGSCRMIDSRNYPTFVSVKKNDGKWETAVCSSVNFSWVRSNDKQDDYFNSVSKMMNFLSELEFLSNTRQVPPILVKK